MDFFSNCRNLETLNLRNNPLKTLNLGKNMKKLKTLLVSFCLLEKVPENIETLTSITKIDFSYNKLTELPINLAKLQATLRDLDLSGNLIRALPAEYLKLSLKQFNFGQNLTAPCFWRESSVSQPKRLRDICLMSVLKGMNCEVPDDIKQQVQDSQYICGTVRSKICGRLRNFVIFGHFQNNFRPKNRNFQNCPIKRARRASRKGNFENFDFLAENYSENIQKLPN